MAGVAVYVVPAVEAAAESGERNTYCTDIKKGPGYSSPLEAMMGPREALIYVTCVYNVEKKIKKVKFGSYSSCLSTSTVTCHEIPKLTLQVADPSVLLPELASWNISLCPLCSSINRSQQFAEPLTSSMHRSDDENELQQYDQYNISVILKLEGEPWHIGCSVPCDLEVIGCSTRSRLLQKMQHKVRLHFTLAMFNRNGTSKVNLGFAWAASFFRDSVGQLLCEYGCRASLGLHRRSGRDTHISGPFPFNNFRLLSRSYGAFQRHCIYPQLRIERVRPPRLQSTIEYFALSNKANAPFFPKFLQSGGSPSEGDAQRGETLAAAVGKRGLAQGFQLN
ncbi:Selenium-binding protein 2 [Platanthera guangdongensis]|uniref:Selenium-binding protein 2 n=1 Tax=Platanthera guangdongensis TaxID=2320717 RepID=A0ABR2MBJ8_9ASPA